MLKRTYEHRAVGSNRRAGASPAARAMSFTFDTKPRIGEVARCCRCKCTWFAVTCQCGDPKCGAMLVTSQHLSLADDVSAKLVADRAPYFCPKCMANDEHYAVQMKARAETRGEARN